MINIKTTIQLFRNKRNKNKYIEVHNDSHYHNAARQFMSWDNGVKNLLGDKKLHRIRKKFLEELLKDYEECEKDEFH